jgi:hypothetical protein
MKANVPKTAHKTPSRTAALRSLSTTPASGVRTVGHRTVTVSLTIGGVAVGAPITGVFNFHLNGVVIMVKR